MYSYTIATTTDGFGAQYKKTIETYILCKYNNLNFVYKPFSMVEHNYNNDTEYILKLENLINLKDNLININEKMSVIELDYCSSI